MQEQRITDVGYDQVEADFHEQDLELIAKLRAQCDLLRASPEGTSQVMKCPRCAAAMQELDLRHVKVDRCTRCGGIFLDRGELEILTLAKTGGLFKRLFQRLETLSPT